MQNYKLKVGIAPTRRGISSNRKGAFTVEDSIKIKEQVLKEISTFADSQVEFVTIDWLNEEGIMSDIDHASKVAERFKTEKVDALFIFHCNFGCEESVGKLARLIEKPVLLWGPRDEKIGEDGSRATDTQCGLFASSRLMMRYGIPFSYIENCKLSDNAFKEGFDKFLSVATVVKTLNNLRIGQINSRPKYFTSVMYNESELMEKFGIEIVPINIAVVEQKMFEIRTSHFDSVQSALNDIKARIDCSQIDEESLIKIATLKLAIKDLADIHKCDAMATECWTVTPLALGVLPCLAMAELTDAGLPVTCETDINGAITSILLTAAARGKKPTFFGEYTMRHPDNDNAELVWHCGPYPYSLKKDNVDAKFIGGRPSWEIKGGDITLSRFDANRGSYYLFADHVKGTDGPYTSGTYTWVEADNWIKWEKKFVNGPYIHHVSGIHGKYAHILEEACKYIPELTYDCAK